ncbi:MAG: hypothetical protein ACP6IY_18785, partial [Promethearchaeia archaeon]
MLSKIGINKLILIGLCTYIFILFNLAALEIMLAMQYIVGGLIIIYEIAFLTLYFIIIYLILNSRIIRLISALIIMLISGLFLILLILFSFFNFIILKLELAIIFILSLFCNYYNFKYIFERHPTFVFHNKYFKISIILIPLISCSILFLPIQSIKIEPKVNPEIFFWTSAAGIPNDNNTLDFCAENNIGFVVVLRENYISDGGAEELAEIKRAINHNVKIYINLGGPTNSFYCNLDSAKEFPNIFDTIRLWLINNGIYDDIEGFTVDAEPPSIL